MTDKKFSLIDTGSYAGYVTLHLEGPSFTVLSREDGSVDIQMRPETAAFVVEALWGELERILGCRKVELKPVTRGSNG